MRKFLLSVALMAGISVPVSIAYAAKPSAAAPADANAPQTVHSNSFCHVVLLETKFFYLRNGDSSVKQETSASTDHSPELAGIIPTGG